MVCTVKNEKKLTVPLDVVVTSLSAVKVSDALPLVVPSQHISWPYQTVVVPRQLEVEVYACGACRDYVLAEQDVRARYSVNRPPNLNGLCPRAAGEDVVSSDPADICEGQLRVHELDVARSVRGLAVNDLVAEAADPLC